MIIFLTKTGLIRVDPLNVSGDILTKTWIENFYVCDLELKVLKVTEGFSMVQHKTLDQYLPSWQILTRSIQRFRRYRLMKTLTFCNANVNKDALALSIHSYRQANDRPVLKHHITKA